MKATFHERQYELAVNLELIAGSGMFFAPMQVIEESVGYDIALIPGHAAVWSYLGIGAAPSGVETAVEYDATLKPLTGGQTFAASLFLQYKRARADGAPKRGGGPREDVPGWRSAVLPRGSE